MENYRIDYLPLAKKDLEKAVAYIALELQAPETARSLLTALDEAANNLKQMPYRFAVYPLTSTLLAEVRFIPVGSYNLFYQVDEARKTVTVLRVLHQRQDAKRQGVSKE